MLRRYAARLLIFALVPLVAFAQPGAAEATVYGAVAPFEVSKHYTEEQGLPDLGGGYTIACSGTGAYKVDGTTNTVIGKVVCDVDVDLWNDPSAGDLTDSTVSMLFKGSREGDTTPCTYSTLPIMGDLLTTQSYSTGPNNTPCQVTEVCVSAYATDPGVMARHDSYAITSACVPLPLGPLPKEAAKCAYGTVTRASAMNQAYGTTAYHGRQIEIRVTLPPSTEFTSDAPYKYWRVDVRTQAGLTPPNIGQVGPWKQVSTSTTLGDKWGPDDPLIWAYRPPGSTGNLNQNAQMIEPAGAWVYLAASPDFTTGTRLPGQSRGHSDLRWGDNDPAACHFYFGPKLRDEPGTLDEPAGEMNGLDTPEGEDPDTDEPNLDPTPVTEVGDPCDFSFTDPTTWVSSGICKLVELFRSAVNTLRSIFGTLGDILGVLRDWIGDLLDGLADLLIPTGNFGVQALINQLQAKPPFSLALELGDQAGAVADAYSSGGDCGTLLAFGDTTVSCASIRDAPGMSALYALVQWGLVGLTGYGMFNRVSSLLERGQ